MEYDGGIELELIGKAGFDVDYVCVGRSTHLEDF